MNHEILFRGKRANSLQNDWIEGYFLNLQVEGIKLPCIFPIVPPVEAILSGGLLQVDPATVGQYTGLTDKNGVKIFEGDIVHVLDERKDVDYNALIAFLDGGFCAIDGTAEEYAFKRYVCSRMDFSIEVIGNSHDNPELLREAPNAHP